jgi:two-component system alkaline phosphatase synthesis response regulator PhoP
MPDGIPRPIKILTVDDDKVFSRALELRLAKAGFMTDVVFDGQSAINALTTKKYDLLILDLVMPDMSGFDLLRKIREQNIKVCSVALSMLRQEEDIMLVKELGASEYLTKSSPTFMDELVKFAEKLSVS